MLCIHCYVSGKVQGVWFRASTQNEANRLGVKGWVKNIPDGRVEVLAVGEKESVLQLFAWLKQGPELAEVTEVTYEELPFQNHDRFAVK